MVEADNRAGGAAGSAWPVNSAETPSDAISGAMKQRAVDMAKQARAAMAQGDWATAEQIARQAELLAPDTAFASGEDRPTLVLLDIQRAKGSEGGDAARNRRRARAWRATVIRA